MAVRPDGHGLRARFRTRALARLRIETGDLNLLNPDGVAAIHEAVAAVPADVSVLVIRGDGPAGDLSAGLDLSVASDLEVSDAREIRDMIRAARDHPAVTVCGVGGYAMGAALELAMACDLRIVGPDALLREGFVRVGLVPGDGGGWLLPRLIGESKAREYLLTGMDIDAEEAVEIRLAAERVEDALTGAHSWAEDLLALPAVAVRHTNRLIDPSQSFEDYCERAIAYQWECVNDQEHAEAIAAFNEGREPEFDRDY